MASSSDPDIRVRAKITTVEVEQIRGLYAEGDWAQKDLAREFNLSSRTSPVS